MDASRRGKIKKKEGKEKKRKPSRCIVAWLVMYKVWPSDRLYRVMFNSSFLCPRYSGYKNAETFPRRSFTRRRIKKKKKKKKGKYYIIFFLCNLFDYEHLDDRLKRINLFFM